MDNAKQDMGQTEQTEQARIMKAKAKIISFVKAGDFIEVIFTGRLMDGTIFDTNDKDELNKLGAAKELIMACKPAVLCI